MSSCKCPYITNTVSRGYTRHARTDTGIAGKGLATRLMESLPAEVPFTPTPM
jgi:hypothetical protein